MGIENSNSKEGCAVRVSETQPGPKRRRHTRVALLIGLRLSPGSPSHQPGPALLIHSTHSLEKCPLVRNAPHQTSRGLRNHRPPEWGRVHFTAKCDIMASMASFLPVPSESSGRRRVNPPPNRQSAGWSRLLGLRTAGRGLSRPALCGENEHLGRQCQRLGGTHQQGRQTSHQNYQALYPS